jgi:hypothetical protein
MLMRIYPRLKRTRMCRPVLSPRFDRVSSSTIARCLSFIFSAIFVLNFAGCGGSSSAPPPPSGPTITSVNISPMSVSLQTSQPQQFTGTVNGTGNFNPSLQWFVNDISGGNSTVGTVDSNGLYNAPAQLPNPPTLTVKAVSAADSSKSASAQATIRAIQKPTIVWPETNLSIPGGDDGESTETPPGIDLVDDGAGGVYVLWEHRFPVEILAQHLNANGSPTWAAGGILVTNPWTGYQASPRAVSDGAGGVIVVWVDGRAGFCDPSFQASCDIYGQRLGPTGALLWGPTGKPICTAANNQGLGGMAVLSDGSGGILVAFQDDRINSTSQGGSGGYTLYVQRMDANGNPVWQVDGVRIGQDPQAGDAGSISRLKMISDGQNGAIAAWYFTSYQGTAHLSIQAQRISSSGQPLWTSGGVAVPGLTSNDPNGTGIETLDLTADNQGGGLLVASWTPPNETRAKVFAQRVDKNGTASWTQSGVLISSSTNDNLNPSILSDGSGGLFAAWQDCPNIGSNCDIAMQRLDSTGKPPWGPNQISISQMPNQQLAPTMQTDGNGGVLVLWTDCRAYPDANSCYANSDVYAQHVDSSGNNLWMFNGFPLLADPGNQGEQYYVYTPLPAVVSLRLQSGDIVMAWPDGRHNICFNGNAQTACELFVSNFKF